MNKKAISPLIATVLLVSFVVILSGIIMFWGRQYVTELMEKKGETAMAKQECVVGVSFEVTSANPTKVSIINSGSKKLSGFILKFPGDPPCEISQSVNAYENVDIALTQCPNTDGDDQVNVIPIIKPQGIGAPSIPCSTQNKLINIGG